MYTCPCGLASFMAPDADLFFFCMSLYAYSRFPSLSLSAVQQTQLVENGVIPRLVTIMQQYPENDPLVNVCLLALCNLADVGKANVQTMWSSKIMLNVKKKTIKKYQCHPHFFLSSLLFFFTLKKCWS